MIERRIRFSRPLTAVALADSGKPLVPGVGSGSCAPAPAASRAVEAEAEGRKQHEQERAAIESVVAGLQEAARELEEHRRQLLGELQQLAVELAVAIASRLVYEKIQANDFGVEALVRSAVDRLEAKGPVVVRLNPDDLNLLRQRLGGQALSSGVELQLVEDSAMPRGDCTVQAGEVCLLSQVDAQLDDIRRHLLRSLGDAQVERRNAATGDRKLRRFPDRRQTA